MVMFAQHYDVFPVSYSVRCIVKHIKFPRNFHHFAVKISVVPIRSQMPLVIRVKSWPCSQSPVDD